MSNKIVLQKKVTFQDTGKMFAADQDQKPWISEDQFKPASSAL